MAPPIRPLAALLVMTGCASVPSRMDYMKVESPAMGSRMALGIYTPPGFAPGEQLPVFLFLHGGGDDVRCLEKNGVAAWLDREIVAGRLPRVVIVVPQGDLGFWANWADGSRHYEDWALREALPAAIRGLGIPECPGGCHLLGISMGANGGLRALLDHPEEFRSAGLLSGPMFDEAEMRALRERLIVRIFLPIDRVFGDDEERMRAADPFQRWQSAADLHGVRLFLAWGDSDKPGIGETNEALERHLEARGIPFEHRVFHGGHRWSDWTPVLGEAIREALR